MTLISAKRVYMQETTFGKTGWPELCPVVFSCPGGFFVVMKRAEPLPMRDYVELDFHAFTQKRDYTVPVENKLDSFGMLDGKVVAVDYGT